MDDSDGMGIDGSLFQESLIALDAMDKKRIQVWINSVGGNVLDGYNICNAILNTKTPVDTFCMGMAASIAGVIFQTGRKRIMADYGILMYHNPYSGNVTKSPVLDNMKESLNTIIRNRSGMNVDAVHDMMDRTTFIQCDEAMKMGLCDEVEVTAKLNTKYLPRVVNDGKEFFLAANKVLNKLFENQTIKKMLKVTNKLNLNEAANEDAIVSAIEAVENRATLAEQGKQEAEDALNALKLEKEAKEAELLEATNKYNEAKILLDAQEAENARIADLSATEKAKNLIEFAVTDGKIKNESAVIDAWKAKAKADFEGTKALLDGVSINKAANKIVIASKEEEDKAKYNNVAADMVAIENKLKTK